MIYSIIINILLALVILYMLVKLNQRTKEKEQWMKQEKREWLLKVALEQSCKLPGVEADELAPVEDEINKLMEAGMKESGVEEKIRSLIMGLYEAKYDAKKAEKEAAQAAQKPAPRRDTPPITGRNPGR